MRRHATAPLALEGPKAAALIKGDFRADVANFEELSGHGGKKGWSDSPLDSHKRSPGGVPGAEFLAGGAKSCQRLWQILSDEARWQKAGPWDTPRLSATRLASGLCRGLGFRLRGKKFPHEAGLQDAHKLHKGLLQPGQERKSSKRVRSRGQVQNRQPASNWLFPGEVVPGKAGMPLMLEGKEKWATLACGGDLGPNGPHH